MRSSVSLTDPSGSATGSRLPPTTRRCRATSWPIGWWRRARGRSSSGRRRWCDGPRGDDVSARAGVVYLVGAGPGDPGLVTMRAMELIGSADVVVHDRLIPGGLLDAARGDAELVDVGKRPGEGSVAGETRGSEDAQRAIEDLIADRARRGRSVVRLKGGDPFVFGRGGEEAEM